MTNPDNGYFGELYANALGFFYVLGTYERLDKTPYSGCFILKPMQHRKVCRLFSAAEYDKVNISSETEIFTLDNRSLLYFEFGYKPSPYIVVSMLNKWTFTPVYDS